MASKTMKPPKTIAPKAAVRPEVNGAATGKSEETIRLLAYLKWEKAGKPDKATAFVTGSKPSVELCPA